MLNLIYNLLFNNKMTLDMVEYYIFLLFKTLKDIQKIEIGIIITFQYAQSVSKHEKSTLPHIFVAVADSHTSKSISEALLGVHVSLFFKISHIPLDFFMIPLFIKEYWCTKSSYF